VTIVLIGVAENVEELIVNHQSLRRALSLVKLERMNIVDLSKILDGRLQLTPLQLSDDVCSEIVTLSCGLPYYVQTLGKSATQNAIKHQRDRVEIEDVDAAIDNFLFESGQTFVNDYQRATDSQQAGNISHQVLMASALALADSGGFFKPTEVGETLNLIFPGNSYSYSRIQQYLAQFVLDRRGKILIRTGVKGDYRYRFSDALMQPFVVMRGIKDTIIDKTLRQRLFHLSRDQFRDGGCRLGVAEANAAKFGMINPTITDTGRWQAMPAVTLPEQLEEPLCGSDPT
jgi:hypothetical protein